MVGFRETLRGCFELNRQGPQRIGQEETMDIEETDVVVIGMGPGSDAALVADLRSMIYAYPAFHRTIEDAVQDLASR
jgi:hypothetical protein